MEHYDVVVVGAGPIGCSVAYQIAQQHHRVALVEEHETVGEPLQCAGLITQRVFDLLSIPQTNIIQNTIYGAHIHSPAGHILTIGGDKTHALVINRTQFDQKLSAQTCDAGTEIFLKSRTTSVQQNSTGVDLNIIHHGKTQHLNSSILIGADGPHSTIRSLFGFPQPAEILRSIGAEVTNISLDPRYVEIFLGHDIAPGFFAWVIPTNIQGTEARIGLCCDNTGSPQQCFKQFLKQPLLQETTITTRIGGAIPLGPLKKTVHSHVVLVGDAAAQVKPTSGGGIYTGLVCARHCATAVHQALQGNIVDLRALKTYHTTWTKDIGRELNLGMRFRTLYRRFTDEQFDTYLQKFNDDKTIDVINTYGDIDYPSKLAFPLLKTTPSLLKFLPLFLRKKK